MQKNESYKMSVLVVDDNPAGLYLTAKMLKLENFNIIEASSRKDALDKIRQKPDVIILDVKLPDINGFEVCRRIKSDPSTSNIPVIHLTATYLDADSKAFGLDSGADAYLTHPVESKVLIATINAVMRIRIAEAKLAEAALQWKATFDSINDGVCLLDCSSQINRCNKKFIEITGSSRESLIGCKLKNVLPEFMKFDFPNFFNTLAEKSENIKEEVHIEGKVYSVSASPVAGPDEECGGFVFKLSDITYQKESEERIKKTLAELEFLNTQLERSNRELEQFAYAASHDLQEPIRMIANFTKLLEKKINLSPEDKTLEYFNIIQESAVRMQKLIHDLLDYSRVSTMGLKFEPVEMELVVKDVIINLKMAIEESKTKISHDPLPVVKGDFTRLIQLLQNLISNAIKFRGDNAPAVHISVRKDVSGKWVFSVSDNGIGIEEEFYNRIFVIFQRLHEREKYEGTGIGLALCKKIVDQHGGNIWVESIPGKGSTFYFSLMAFN